MGSMTVDLESEQHARIAIHLLTEPGKAKVGARIAALGAPQVARALAREHEPVVALDSLAQAVAGQLARAAAAGVTCVVPGTPEWPRQLDDLDDSRPVVLWVRSDSPDTLRKDLLRSISVVGSRACSPYGRRLAENLGSRCRPVRVDGGVGRRLQGSTLQHTREHWPPVGLPCW